MKRWKEEPVDIEKITDVLLSFDIDDRTIKC